MTLLSLNRSWPYQKSSSESDIPFGWRQFDIDTAELFGAVVGDGWAFAAHHRAGGKARINTGTFISSNYLVADIDSGQTYKEVIEKASVRPTFVYETPSHTMASPRCRAVWETPRSLVKEEYESAQRGLFFSLSQDSIFSDLSCWNASRIWFGARRGSAFDYSGRVLKKEELEILLEIAPDFSKTQIGGRHIPPRPVLRGPGGNLTRSNYDMWLDFIPRLLSSNGTIIPKSSRHNTLLYIAFECSKWLSPPEVQSLLVDTVPMLAVVNGDRVITEHEIENIVRYVFAKGS